MEETKKSNGRGILILGGHLYGVNSYRLINKANGHNMEANGFVDWIGSRHS